MPHLGEVKGHGQDPWKFCYSGPRSDVRVEVDLSGTGVACPGSWWGDNAGLQNDLVSRKETILDWLDVGHRQRENSTWNGFAVCAEFSSTAIPAIQRGDTGHRRLSFIMSLAIGRTSVDTQERSLKLVSWVSVAIRSLLLVAGTSVRQIEFVV